MSDRSSKRGAIVPLGNWVELEGRERVAYARGASAPVADFGLEGATDQFLADLFASARRKSLRAEDEGFETAGVLRVTGAGFYCFEAANEIELVQGSGSRRDPTERKRVWFDPARISDTLLMLDGSGAGVEVAASTSDAPLRVRRVQASENETGGVVDRRVENPLGSSVDVASLKDDWLVSYVREVARPRDTVERVAQAVGSSVLLLRDDRTPSARLSARLRGEVAPLERSARLWASGLEQSHVDRLSRWVAIECAGMEAQADEHFETPDFDDAAWWQGSQAFASRRERLEAVVWVLRSKLEGDAFPLTRVPELDDRLEAHVDAALGVSRSLVEADEALRRADARGTAGWWARLAEPEDD